MENKKSAGGIIFREEKGVLKYLLLHYTAGHWDFPKGNIERNESLKETTRREIGEETGIFKINFIPGFKESIEYFYKLKDKKIFKTVTFFLVKTETVKVKISWEHQSYKWLSYQKALEQLTFKNAKEVLKKAHKFLLKKC